MSSEITEFQGGYRWLSNFWLCPVDVSGVRYPSAEHAYQAAKTLDAGARLAIAGLASPGQAKRAGQQLELRPGWEQARKRIMLGVVVIKFTQNPHLGCQLAETGDALLEEGNRWHDNYWGACGCPRHMGLGLNYLGRILMMVRDIVRED
jgi:ribA/ribD-fused uncharacterized protein